MDEPISANRALWNHWTALHAPSAFYDVAGFKAGRSSLFPVEVAEVGDVRGKSLLHLQCHFGQDTLSWARLGATVTGADLADDAITLAQQLSAELGLPATFVCANLYNLPTVLADTFDIVYTGGGVLSWLPDLPGWGRIVAHYLKPGGIFYIREHHPFSELFEVLPDGNLRLAYPYFPTPTPQGYETDGSYAAPGNGSSFTGYNWNHSLGEIVGAVLDAGLQLEFLHEFAHTGYSVQFPDMVQDAEGWRATGPAANLPLMFSIRARKPG